MQAELDPLVFELDLSLEGLEAEKEQLAKQIFSREFPDIWDAENVNQHTLRQILSFSIAKQIMAFDFYVANYLISFIILFAGFLVILTFLRSLSLSGKRFADPREGYIVYAIRFMVLMEAMAVLFNSYGRYNLSKTLMIAAM